MKLATLLAEMEHEIAISIEDTNGKEIYNGTVEQAIEILNNTLLNGRIYSIVPNHTARTNYLIIGIYV
jgi:predicted metalloenzyme YecM